MPLLNCLEGGLGKHAEQLEEAEGKERMTSSEFVTYVRARVKAVGLKNPYIVGMMVPAASFKRAGDLKREHSEGGGLCPTMGKAPEYKPVTTWLDEVAGALLEWNYPEPAKKGSE